MDGKYTGVIEAASTAVVEGLLVDPEQVIGHGRQLDQVVRDLLRAVGREVMTRVLAEVGNYLARGAVGPGLTVRRAPEVEYKTVFGLVHVRSPYLWSREGRSLRPLREVFGVEGGGMSDAVDRALTDFGAERSFERASKALREHYGWEIGRTTVLGHTERAAADAEAFLGEVWAEATSGFGEPLRERPGVDTLLVELDGCEIRTGRLMTAAEAGRTDRKPDAKVRLEAWREVRTGLARPLEEVDSTYVSALAPYPEVCRQLHAAACRRGLSRRSQVVAVGDGGQGLREELDAHFPGAQFILDHPHLVTHLNETAATLGFGADFHREWVGTQLERLWQGEVAIVLADLEALYDRTGCDRVRQLRAYLDRFKDAVDYGVYRHNGWPIGSGEVESAHRHFPQERLKIPGACWRQETLNPMLALRVVRANGFWEDFWTWRHDRARATVSAPVN